MIAERCSKCGCELVLCEVCHHYYCAICERHYGEYCPKCTVNELTQPDASVTGDLNAR